MALLCPICKSIARELDRTGDATGFDCERQWITANVAKLPELVRKTLKAHQKSLLFITGHSPAVVLCFALRSAASHCALVQFLTRRSATTVSATLNFPSVSQSNPVASPVRSSSCAMDLQIGQRRAMSRLIYLGPFALARSARVIRQTTKSTKAPRFELGVMLMGKMVSMPPSASRLKPTAKCAGGGVLVFVCRATFFFHLRMSEAVYCRSQYGGHHSCRFSAKMI